MCHSLRLDVNEVGLRACFFAMEGRGEVRGYGCSCVSLVRDVFKGKGSKGAIRLIGDSAPEPWEPTLCDFILP